MDEVVWSSSTAGVEQRFIIGDRLAIEKTAASQVQESLVLQAAFDKVGSLKEKRAIAERARELFVQGSPRTRRDRCNRLDKGTKRQLKVEEIDRSEVGWLRRRRCTVALGSRTAKEQQAIAPAPRRRRQRIELAGLVQKLLHAFSHCLRTSGRVQHADSEHRRLGQLERDRSNEVAKTQ